MSRAAIPRAAVFGPDKAIPPTSRVGEHLVGEHLTEARLAERFAEAHGLDLRYHHRRNSWLIYESPVWRLDTDGQVYRRALVFVQGQQADALAIPDRKAKEEQVQFALRAESKTALDRLIGLAKNLKPLADAGTGWDADPWLLGAPNGVIDLRSGTLRSGDPADRITKRVSVPYDPEAECPRWCQFQREIFSNRADLIDWMHRFVGYACTGLTHEQVLACLYGSGANGTSTFLEVLRYVLGDYAWNMPFSTIELRQRSSIPADLAALEGRRLVTASETSDRVQLNEARLKALTGSDTVTARRLYSDHFEFQQTAKFWLAFNHKPVVHDDSHGFWRRVRLIPFLRTFNGSTQDLELPAQLRTEAPGILRWMVAGCLAWQTSGLAPPDIVLAATTEYQQDSDPLRDFLDECCDPDPNHEVSAAALYEAYVKWCDRQKFSKDDRMSNQAFGRRVGDRFERRHTMRGKVYCGLKIVFDRLL